VAVARLGSRVLQALVVADTRDIVHCDPKPSNLFLPAGDLEQAKLLDFGIARRAEADWPVTRPGAALGTPLCMAPEQARDGDAVDGARTSFPWVACWSNARSAGCPTCTQIAAAEPAPGTTPRSLSCTQACPRLCGWCWIEWWRLTRRRGRATLETCLAGSSPTVLLKRPFQRPSDNQMKDSADFIRWLIQLIPQSRTCGPALLTALALGAACNRYARWRRSLLASCSVCSTSPGVEPGYSSGPLPVVCGLRVSAERTIFYQGHDEDEGLDESWPLSNHRGRGPHGGVLLGCLRDLIAGEACHDRLSVGVRLLDRNQVHRWNGA